MNKEQAKKLKIGDRIAAGESDSGDFTSKLKYDRIYGDTALIFGKVVKTFSKNKIGVVWDHESFNHPIYDNDNILLFTGYEISFTHLLLEADARNQMSALEQEYEKIEAKAKSKLEQAAKLIKETNKMAKKVGLDGLSDMYDISDILLSALDDCGWQTSSMGC